MPAFEVDDDLAELVWRLARPKPFEQLTFSLALRRVLQYASAQPNEVEPANRQMPMSAAPSASARQWQKKAPSPDPAQWAAAVPELRSHENLATWQAICDVLRIKVAGDSARRKLRTWVKANRPNWPDVPTIEGDA
jgi:hypothetical protein